VSLGVARGDAVDLLRREHVSIRDWSILRGTKPRRAEAIAPM
jgi:hypothetical protein